MTRGGKYWRHWADRLFIGLEAQKVATPLAIASGFGRVYMVMGERGMADMTEMEMPIPDNTAPMMTGQGPFGSVEMGGMFSILKVRKNQAHGDYSDPGWFNHPAGTVAKAYTGDPAQLPSSGQAPTPSVSPTTSHQPEIEMKVRKPMQHHHE